MDKNIQELPLRVALYLRVSTDEQAEKYGLDAQRSAVEAIIKSKGKLKNGNDVATFAGNQFVYIDDGVSGTIDIDQRPAFTRLKEDILNAPQGQRPFDVVAVYKIDRFARKLRILMNVLNFFEQYDIEFISATESIDTSSPFGRAMLGIMGVIAELELETIKERTQRGREQAVEDGVFMGSHAPFGFNKNTDGQLVVFEEEAKTINKIFQLFTIQKLSPQKIADILTSEEVLSPDASAVKYQKRKGTIQKLNSLSFWRAERVRDILTDEIYTGLLYYNKTKHNKRLPKKEWKLSPHRHEAIIYTQIYQLAQQRLQELSDRKVLTRRKEDSHIYLLSSLLKCDHCNKLVHPVDDSRMTWTGTKKILDKSNHTYSYYYQCGRKNRKKFSIICPVVPIPAKEIEDYVLNFIKQLLKDPQATYSYQKQLTSTKLSTKHFKDNRDHYVRLLNALPSRKKSLLEQHEIGAIDKSALQNKLNELALKEKEYNEKINKIDFELSQISLSSGYVESLKLYADKYSKSLDKSLKDEKEIYDLIHMLIHEVIVYSRPRDEKDKIAGRKKADQFIPNRIDILLNLPQHLLRELHAQEFVVENVNL